MIDVRSAHLAEARAAGELLAPPAPLMSWTRYLFCWRSGDQLLTNDPDDLTVLIDERGIPVAVVRI